MSVVLTLPSFRLRSWTQQDFQVVSRAAGELRKVGDGGGKSSDQFRESCRQLLEIALRGDPENILIYVSKPLHVRALTFLLGSSEPFAKEVLITGKLLKRIQKVRSPLSRLSLAQLVRAFFVNFDLGAQGRDLKVWAQFLDQQLQQFDRKIGSSELKLWAKHRAILFDTEGPSLVVGKTRSGKKDLSDTLSRFGLNGFQEGRFVRLCQYQYYLETLKKIDLGADDPVLAEICRKEVAEAPMGPGKLLGHTALEILIDRTGAAPISDAWRATILTIAGDPRVPTSNLKYQRWWILLGEKRIALMRGWLSRFDLKLFLDILEQSAKDGGISDMERMFESRKVFMEGLLGADYVSESRLILGRYAVSYLKKHFPKKEQLPSYATVDSSQTSMIYLNISGRVHMVEGSHSFTLKLMNRLPQKCGVADYSRSRFNDYELRTMIKEQYNREFRSSDGLMQAKHDVHLNWQNRAIEFLNANGIPIKPHVVLSQKRSREYKRKFGAG